MLPEQRAQFPPMSVQIKDGTSVMLRMLVPDDAERLARFYAAIPPEDIRFYCPHPLDREHALRNAAAANDPGRIVLVIDCADEIAGYCWIRGDQHSGTFGLCVRKEFQGRGAGKLLLRRFFEIVDQVGPPLVKLTVQEQNPAAVLLYTEVGFEVVRKGMRQANPKYGALEEPQFWMERRRPT